MLQVVVCARLVWRRWSREVCPLPPLNSVTQVSRHHHQLHHDRQPPCRKGITRFKDIGDDISIQEIDQKHQRRRQELRRVFQVTRALISLISAEFFFLFKLSTNFARSRDSGIDDNRDCCSCRQSSVSSRSPSTISPTPSPPTPSSSTPSPPTPSLSLTRWPCSTLAGTATVGQRWGAKGAVAAQPTRQGDTARPLQQGGQPGTSSLFSSLPCF